jgi:hypothetical protein
MNRTLAVSNTKQDLQENKKMSDVNAADEGAGRGCCTNYMCNPKKKRTELLFVCVVQTFVSHVQM